MYLVFSLPHVKPNILTTQNLNINTADSTKY